MNFIFYQKNTSIHQSAFLRSLAINNNVTLIVQNELNDKRIKQGWYQPNFGNTNIVIDPDNKILGHFLSQSDAIHIFSGIDSYKLTATAFKIAVKNNLKIGIYSEPFDWTGMKGKLRFLKYWILKIKYNKHIDFILAIGNRGRWCYEKACFSKSKIFDWGYFTEKVALDISYKEENQLPNIIFIGTLNTNKNILSLISVCKQLNKQIGILQIIGDGPLKKNVLQNIRNTNFEYIENLPNKDVQLKINESDLLVLPSIYKDGWGAVVNEALMCGVPVITSDNCGASVLLDNNERGWVFSVTENNLKETLIKALQQLPYSVERKQGIKDWALQSISGEVAANYFVKIYKYVYEQNRHKPTAPWIYK